MNEFLRGATAACCLLAGLFFLRFWRITRERLFLIFCFSFWIFALNWTVLALAPQFAEHVYVLRFLAFLAIAIGIIDKNRSS